MIKWSDEDDLYLFTPEEFEKLPNGFQLSGISGVGTYVKGVDSIDQDTRFGYLAFGVKDPWNHPEKNLFLTFVLSE
jgi:hypothetical protein